MQGKTNRLHYYIKVAVIYSTVVIAACKTSSRIDHIESANYPLNKPGYTTEDSSLLSIVSPYRMQVDSALNTVIAESEVAMDKNQPEGLLGNFVADIALEETKKYYRASASAEVDFCFLNNGGLRSTLPKGKITKRNIFELMPFDNELVIVTMSGIALQQLFSFIAQKGGVPVSGLHMKVSAGTASEIVINNNPFDTLKTYRFVTSDYLANGGDNLKLMQEAEKKEKTGIILRDAIINNITEKNNKGIVITAKLEGRISN